MSSAAGTRIFGLRVNMDPKIIVGALVVIAGLLFWYNSGSDDSPAASVATSFSPVPAATAPPSQTRAAIVQRRAGAPSNERGTLRLRPIDATHGDVDPTLRLDLLRRLRTLQLTPATRSLFEIGAIATLAATANGSAAKIVGPKINVTNPLLNAASVTAPPTVINTAVNIPLKYYGFVKPTTANSISTGLFLDGDNVLVATEGQTVSIPNQPKRYLVVELTPTSARLEDTQLKQGQTLPVVPVAAQ